MAVFAVAPDPLRDFPGSEGTGTSGRGGSGRGRRGDSFSLSINPKSSGGMSGQNWDKVVKGATKTKHAPPKSKYIDPLIKGTFEGEYSVSDIAQAIAPRLRDSNSSVVFKALILTHLLLRTGSLKPVYVVLSSKPHLLGLNAVTSGHDSVQNLTKYAYYLHTRLKTYASLGRDAIRDRSERRAEGRGDGGEKLRGMSVEKGLLREVATLQKLLDALLECKFYLEDRDDEVTMTALRLLVKDLLVLFTSVNEGVINVLEHYFEMSHVDATTSLKIYKHFCKQTEKVVTYLGVAKKMQSVLNVQVPNLKHAPVSLAGSLEEYLKDPNFEANRLEYKRNREIAEGKTPKPSKSPSGQPNTPTSKATNGASSSSTPAGASNGDSGAAPTAAGSKAFVDFFEAIEQEQTSMFDPQTGSPNQQYFQQQAAYNPFLRQQMPAPFGPLQPQMTGAMMMGSPFGQPGQGQHLQPQMTGFAPFGGMQNAFAPPGQVQPQQTGFLQPQQTGFNPFRQSMMMPQMTGNPFQQQQQQQAQPQPTGQQGGQPSGSDGNGSGVKQLTPQWTGIQAFQRPQSAQAGSNAFAPERQQTSSPFGQAGPFSQANNTNNNQQQQPHQQPSQSQAGGAPHPLAPQPTGSKNPFAPPPGSIPEPKPAPPPSMNQLAFQAFQNSQNPPQQQQQPFQSNNGNVQQPQQAQQQQNGGNSSFGASGGFGDLLGGGGSNGQQQQPKPQVPQQTGFMGSIASDFALGRTASPSANNPASNGSTGGAPGLPSISSTSSGMPSFSNDVLSSFTGSSAAPSTTSNSTAPSFGFSSATSAPSSSAPSPLKPQATGFGGSSIKPFQPTSSFGASLLAQNANKTDGSPAPAQNQQQQQQQPSQPSANLLGFGDNSTPSGFQPNTITNNSSNSAGVNFGMGGSQPALTQQQTGAPNPFRMASPSPAQQNAFASSNLFSTYPQANNNNNSSNGNSQPNQWGSLI